jgi:hypothetical protein
VGVHLVGVARPAERDGTGEVETASLGPAAGVLHLPGALLGAALCLLGSSSAT